MAQRGGIVGRALARLEEATGQTVVPAERMELLEAYYADYRVLSRELDQIGWGILNYLGGNAQELVPQQRLNMVRQARVVWMNDPQAGAAVELMNDFCFGRGIPKPKAKDKLVQEKIDEAWSDPDNEEVLTTIEAQLALGTDLALQSNVFMLVFGLDEEDGSDGKIKLSILSHDDFAGYMAHPEKRHRVLYYLARETRQEWDFTTHAPKPVDPSTLTQDPTYYAHWRNVDLTEEDGDEVEQPPADLIGRGRVYHLRINRTTEMQLGVPRFQRTLIWYSAYNKYVKDRLDIVAAAAALIMKRKIKGTPTQLARDAAKLLSRESPLALGAPGETARQPGPRPAGILEENESVEHEAFNLDTRAANAMADSQIIRAPISASERFPQSYFGDAGSSSLATATSLELPVLKAVEARQEVFERLVRFFIDRVIERAVDAGEIPEDLSPGEMPKPEKEPYEEEVKATQKAADAAAQPPALNGGPPQGALQQALEEAARDELDAGREVVELARVSPRGGGEEVILIVSADAAGQSHYRLIEAYPKQTADEKDTKRNLSYEFSMPSPLRRMMLDLISGVTQLAQTFDPNNSNPKLSRALLTIAFGEGLEVQDAPELVDEIFPPGYEDPIVKAQLTMGAAPAAPPGPNPNDPAQDPNNPYGAPMDSAPPEQRRSGAYDMQAAEVTGVTRGRDGSRVVWTRRRELSEHQDDHPEPLRRQIEGDRDEATDDFRREVIGTALRELDRARFSEGEQ